MPYGYLGAEPSQVKLNSGVFTADDSFDLISDRTWGGSLELIQSGTFTTAGFVDITNIKEDVYNIHYLRYTAIGSTSINSGLQFYESGVLQTGGVYECSLLYNVVNGSNSGQGGNNNTRITINNFDNVNDTSTQVYLYNLGDASKYSHTTFTSWQSSTTSFFGQGALAQGSVVDGIRIQIHTGTITGEYQLFGVKD